MTAVALGDVARFVRGVTFKPSEVGGGTDTVPVMRTKNVQARLDLSDVIRIPRSKVKRDDQFLRSGDTLISSANSWNLVGKCCWVPDLAEPTAIGGFVTALRPVSPHLDGRYLFYWFSSPHTQTTVRGMANSTTNISNLPIKRCEELSLWLPPIEEQRRIAAILDHAARLQSRARIQVAEVSTLLEQAFLRRFGNPRFQSATVSLLDLCDLQSGATPSKADIELWRGEVPWFSPKDLKQPDLHDSIDHVSEAAVGPRLRLLPPDTVVMVVRGMILAHSVPVSVLRASATINQDLKALLPRRPISADFLATAIRVQSREILSDVSTAAHGTKRLDSKALRAIRLPEVDEVRVAEFDRLAKRLKSLTESCSAQAELFLNLHNALQARAFSGRL